MRLVTARLCLRPFVVEDFDAVHAFASDPTVTRFTDWGPNDEAATRAFVTDASQAMPSNGDDFTFAVTRLDTDEVIGSAAVWVDSKAHNRAEIGYVLASAYWGQVLLVSLVVLVGGVFVGLALVPKSERRRSFRLSR